MNWTLAIVAAALAALAIVPFTAPKLQRHHIYYCQYEGVIPHPHMPGVLVELPFAGQSLPCMYRRNDPVSV